MSQKDTGELPSTYVSLARIQDIRRKMLHGAIGGTPEQQAVAKEVWHNDLPDLLETLEGMHRGDYKEKWSSLGCMSGILLTALGILAAFTIVGGAEALKKEAEREAEAVRQEAGQRCAELGGTYATGGAKVGERTVFCIFRQAVPAGESPAVTP